MFSVTSGLPGAGKTLWTIVHVEAMRKRENREVFYHGIADLALDWRKLEDPLKWHECPTGAIIVIDEAQKWFPTRGNAQRAPEHVAAAATHRHQGHDVFLITQHPGKLDASLRKDIEVHRHLMRKFGTHWVTVHQWQGVRENCDKTRKDSVATQWRYPKEAFKLYKSAEVHTHKVRVPIKLLFALLLPLFVVAAFLWVFRDRSAEPVPPGQTGQPQRATGTMVEQSDRQDGRSRPKTAAEYIADYVPRVPGLEHSAPAYDGLTTPKMVPVPAACVDWPGKGCKCFTQQGTPYRTSSEICLQIVRNGIFLPFDPSPGTTTRETVSARPNAGRAGGVLPPETTESLASRVAPAGG